MPSADRSMLQNEEKSSIDISDNELLVKPLWWQEAVIYQIYPRSFQDTTGNGIGDLNGVIEKLDYIKKLGVDAIWLSPFYPSPMKDFGYDVADYRGVDPIFGSMKDFENLLEEAKKRQIRVIVDFVPNHTSDQHPWFQEACRSKNSAKRDWYIWHDPHPETGGVPNNWQSFFGGPAWTLDKESGQYYLHLFLPEQPDLNYRNPSVKKEILDAMRFWLDKGVDGFRVDVMWLLVKDEQFRDEPDDPEWIEGMPDRDRHLHIYTEDLPETHEIVKSMRLLMDECSTIGGERMMIGEIYLPNDKLARYHGSKDEPECHVPFNFSLLKYALSDWRPENLKELISSYELSLPAGEYPNYVLSNHDKPRAASAVGPDQARVAMMLLLTMRGTITIYYGDEIGMTNGVIPKNMMKDPAGIRQPDNPELNRDPFRTPMQWTDGEFAGFSKVFPWLPVNDNFNSVNVDYQEKNPHSMLSLTRKLIALRKRGHTLSSGTLEFINADEKLLHYRRSHGTTTLEVLLNFSSEPIDLDLEGTVLVSTHELDEKGRLLANQGLVLKIS